MSHIPFARKYRPQAFRDVIGQPQALRALQNALISQKTTYAYLFSGTRGCGKTTLARLLAKALNCLDLSDEGEPCQGCASCLEISRSQSLDVIEIDGASHRGIEDIRQIKESASFQPAIGRFRVFVVDEVHMLTKEAFNALLKTLEEPPSRVKFILATTEPHKVPSTIASRCQKFALRNIEPSLIVGALEKILHNEEILYESKLLGEVAYRAQGSLRDALSLLEQLFSFEPKKMTQKGLEEILGLAPIAFFEAWEEILHEEKIASIWEFVVRIQDAGIEVALFLEQLQEHYQKILKASYGIQEADPLYLEWSQRYLPQETLFILNHLESSLQNLKFSHHPRLHLEMTLLHLLQKPWKQTVDQLLDRLEKMREELKLENASQIENLSSLLPPEEAKSREAKEREKPLEDSLSENPPAKEKLCSSKIAKEPTPTIVEAKETMLSGDFEGIVQFAARELDAQLF